MLKTNATSTKFGYQIFDIKLCDILVDILDLNNELLKLRLNDVSYNNITLLRNIIYIYISFDNFSIFLVEMCSSVVMDYVKSNARDINFRY